MNPALVASRHLRLLDETQSGLERLAVLVVGLGLLVAAAREGYRRGYQDGFRGFDQVAADRPPRAASEVPA